MENPSDIVHPVLFPGIEMLNAAWRSISSHGRNICMDQKGSTTSNNHSVVESQMVNRIGDKGCRLSVDVTD